MWDRNGTTELFYVNRSVLLMPCAQSCSGVERDDFNGAEDREGAAQVCAECVKRLELMSSCDRKDEGEYLSSKSLDGLLFHHTIGRLLL